MTYQTIRHTHYDQGSTTRPIEEVLNLLGDTGEDPQVIALNLIGSDWTPRHHDTFNWHLVIFCNHVFTDDELYPPLNDDKDES